MKILVIGSGDREHAIARALNRDPSVTKIHCAPGNPGTAVMAENHSISVNATEELVALAIRLTVDLVVIGPEVPLLNGLVDELQKKSLPCFGPVRAAALIEGSKEFAKMIMQSAGVATARYESCSSREEIRRACEIFGPPYVVKHDGLASGKGVIVTEDLEEATSRVQSAVDSFHSSLIGPS
jgi:phosphoribosylamine--glycine ligase